jgi:hypothetical protein
MVFCGGFASTPFTAAVVMKAAANNPAAMDSLFISILPCSVYVFSMSKLA